jgi:hypothetical protein
MSPTAIGKPWNGRARSTPGKPPGPTVTSVQNYGQLGLALHPP